MTIADPQSKERRAYWTRGAVVCLLILLGLWIAKAFIAAILWAVVIAIAIDPLHARMRIRWPGKARNVLLASGITLGIGLVVLIPLVAGIAQAAVEARQVVTWIAEAKAHGVPPPAWLGQLPYGAHALQSWWQTHLASPASATRQFDGLAGVDIVAHSRLIGSNMLHRAVIFAFTLLTLFFLLRDRDAIIAQIRIASDRLLGAAGERIGRQAIRSVRGTIDGLVLVGMGEGAVMTIVYLVLGTPHPLLLGMATAVAAMIPFGAAFIFTIAALLLLSMGAAVQAVVVIVTGLVVVGVADHFIRPVLIGGATRLPFLWVLIGILGGAETLGVLGLFVGPAIMAVLVMLWRDYLDYASEPDASALSQD
ncbi:MAG TPA: AI-2E family transporter [Sphingobium sp.]